MKNFQTFSFINSVTTSEGNIVQNFQFYNPTRIIFGKEGINKLPRFLPENSRILVLYGGQSAEKNGTLNDIRQVINGRFYYEEFGGIEPNPHYETLMKAVEQIRRNEINFLLAVGGGSVIDGTKFIAQAALYRGDPWNILTGEGEKVKKALPLGTILTLPATGSEMNNRGVVTKAATQEKLSFASDLIYPKFSILDPTKTYTLPRRQLENGIVDSFVHTLEQYLTYPIGAKVPDYFAEGILKTLLEVAPDVVDSPDNYEARANFMWAATMALNGILGTGVPQDWTTHRIGHELTALYGLDHARTLAVIMPVLWRIKKAEKFGKLLQYAQNVWNIQVGTDEEKVDLAIEKTVEFFKSMGMKMTLAEYDIKKDVDLIVERLELHHQVDLGEHHNITLDVSRQILERI